MQDMRHLNLFEKITRINTKFCFTYNSAIIFCVPKNLIYKAIGDDARNIRKMNEVIGKKIKIIPMPQGLHHAKQFIEAIVNPVKFKDLEIKGDEMILTAGNNQVKAALIGRDKRRFMEMQKIIKDFFGKEFRIV